jgi:hypothetical protein
MPRDLTIVSIEPCAIDEFMETWPCSGLHNVHHVTACFAADGDLVDYEAYTDEQESELVDVQEYDGSGAMSALLDDAFRFSHEIKNQPGLIATYRYVLKASDVTFKRFVTSRGE